jgi:hypothetical protein
VGVVRGERAVIPIIAMLLGFGVVLGLGLIVPQPLAALLAHAQALFEGPA